MWSILDGYAEIWRCRRTLIPVVAVVIGSVSAALFGLRFLVGGAEAPIVNGVHLFRIGGAPGVAELLITVGSWVLALTAGVIAVVARLRAVEISAWRIIRLAVAPASTHMMIGLLVVAALLAGAAIAPVLGLVMFMATLIIFPYLLLRVPITALRQSMTVSELTRGRLLRMTGAVIVGVVVVPLLALTAVSPILRADPVDVLFGLIEVFIVAGQAGVLATIYARAVDLEALDPVLEPHRSPRPSRQAAVAMAGVMLLPALVALGAAQANPFGMPRLTERELDLGTRVTAVGWPSGQPPIIVTADGFFDCRDVNCSERVRHGFEPFQGQIIPPNRVQEVTADGSVLSVDASDYESIVVQRCTRNGTCVRGRIPSAGYPVLAVTATPDGTIHIGTATENDRATTFAVIRCADATCAQPETVALGVFEGSISGARMRIAVDAAGTPTVALASIHFAARAIVCDSPACEHPSNLLDVPADDPVPLAAALFPGRPVGLGMLETVGNELQRCWGCEHGVLMDWVRREPQRGAFTFSKAGLFAVSSDPPSDPGTRSVFIGYQRHPAGHGPYVLWRCQETDCRDKRSLLLNIGPASHAVWLAARDDGSLLVVQDHGTVTTVVLPA